MYVFLSVRTRASAESKLLSSQSVHKKKFSGVAEQVSRVVRGSTWCIACLTHSVQGFAGLTFRFGFLSGAPETLEAEQIGVFDVPAELTCGKVPSPLGGLALCVGSFRGRAWD